MPAFVVFGGLCTIFPGMSVKYFAGDMLRAIRSPLTRRGIAFKALYSRPIRPISRDYQTI